MHPDLYLVAYRAEQRELEARLRHRLAAQERVAAVRHEPHRSGLMTLARTLASAWSAPGRAPSGCCPA